MAVRMTRIVAATINSISVNPAARRWTRTSLFMAAAESDRFSYCTGTSEEFSQQIDRLNYFPQQFISQSSIDFSL